jgi:wyosine [tRNA(Phe)-imidazoG37] synthetase (radical SAM superfamily)
MLQGQRTVYRLTLVKNYNTSDIQNYADLVAIGKPDFIEIKVSEHAIDISHSDQALIRYVY